MRWRSVPSLLRTLAIFVASLHASGGGVSALAEARDIAQAPSQPVLQTDAARASSGIGAEEMAGQTLLFGPAALASPSQDGSLARALEAAPAVAPARPPSTREPHKAPAALSEAWDYGDGSLLHNVLARSRDRHGIAASRAPRRIRAP
jgi:hypothetical protein